MAGYVIPQTGRLVLSTGRPATPIVDIARINGSAASASEPRPAFIPPKPAVPSDFEIPAAWSLNRLMSLVAETSGLDALAILSPRRLGKLVKARFIVMWLARRFTKLSLPQIGLRLGDRDHTTVSNGCQRVEAIITALQVRREDCPRVMAERLWSLDWSRARKC